MFPSIKYSSSLPYTHIGTEERYLHSTQYLAKNCKLSNPIKIGEKYWQLIIPWNYSVTWKNEQ